MANPVKELREEVFILGAGFSKSISAKMPLMAELAESLKHTWMERKSFPPNVGVMTPSGEFKPMRQPSITSAITRVENNVETWLSCLLEPAPFVSESDRWDQKALGLGLIEAVRREIEHGESNTLSSAPPEWLMSMVEYWVRHGSSIITFNYDTLVERAITEHFMRLTRPCTSAHLFPQLTDASRPGWPGGYPEQPSKLFHARIASYPETLQTISRIYTSCMGPQTGVTRGQTITRGKHCTRFQSWVGVLLLTPMAR